MSLADARSTLATVMLVTVLGTAGIALPYPILSPYFLNGGENGLVSFLGIHPKLLLGAVLATYPLGILIGSSFMGALSDHFGRRRTLVLSLCAATAGYLLTALAVYVESFPLFLLARLLTGVCEGNMAIARAVAVDLHPTINRTRALSLIYAMTYGGWLLGPLAGGYLMPFGVANVFLIAAVAVAACALICQLAMIETAAPQQHEARLFAAVSEHNSIRLWAQPEIQRLLVYHLLFTLGLNAFYEFYPLWLVEYFRYDSKQIAWITVATTLSMILTSVLLVTRLRARFGAAPLVAAGAALLSLLLCVLVLATGAQLPYLFAALGLAIAINNGSFPDYMAEHFEHLGAGRVMGLLSTNFCAANVVVAIGGSWIALLGSEWSLLSGALLCLLAVVWLLAFALPRTGAMSTGVAR